MAQSTPRPNAAIYYAVDAFDTSRPRLMGRHAAGEGFLRGFVKRVCAAPWSVHGLRIARTTAGLHESRLSELSILHAARNEAGLNV